MPPSASTQRRSRRLRGGAGSTVAEDTQSGRPAVSTQPAKGKKASRGNSVLSALRSLRRSESSMDCRKDATGTLATLQLDAQDTVSSVTHSGSALGSQDSMRRSPDSSPTSVAANDKECGVSSPMGFPSGGTQRNTRTRKAREERPERTKAGWDADTKDARVVTASATSVWQRVDRDAFPLVTNGEDDQNRLSPRTSASSLSSFESQSIYDPNFGGDSDADGISSPAFHGNPLSNLEQSPSLNSNGAPASGFAPSCDTSSPLHRSPLRQVVSPPTGVSSRRVPLPMHMHPTGTHASRGPSPPVSSRNELATMSSSSSFGLSCGLPGLSPELSEAITHFAAAESITSAVKVSALTMKDWLMRMVPGADDPSMTLFGAAVHNAHIDCCQLLIGGLLQAIAEGALVTPVDLMHGVRDAMPHFNKVERDEAVAGIVRSVSAWLALIAGAPRDHEALQDPRLSPFLQVLHHEAQRHVDEDCHPVFSHLKNYPSAAHLNATDMLHMLISALCPAIRQLFTRRSAPDALPSIEAVAAAGGSAEEEPRSAPPAAPPVPVLHSDWEEDEEEESEEEDVGPDSPEAAAGGEASLKEGAIAARKGKELSAAVEATLPAAGGALGSALIQALAKIEAQAQQDEHGQQAQIVRLLQSIASGEPIMGGSVAQGSEADASTALLHPEAETSTALLGPKAEAPTALQHPEADTSKALQRPKAEAPTALQRPDPEASKALQHPEAEASTELLGQDSWSPSPGGDLHAERSVISLAAHSVAGCDSIDDVAPGGSPRPLTASDCHRPLPREDTPRAAPPVQDSAAVAAAASAAAQLSIEQLLSSPELSKTLRKMADKTLKEAVVGEEKFSAVAQSQEARNYAEYVHGRNRSLERRLHQQQTFMSAMFSMNVMQNQMNTAITEMLVSNEASSNVGRQAAQATSAESLMIRALARNHGHDPNQVAARPRRLSQTSMGSSGSRGVSYFPPAYGGHHRSVVGGGTMMGGVAAGGTTIHPASTFMSAPGQGSHVHRRRSDTCGGASRRPPCSQGPGSSAHKHHVDTSTMSAVSHQLQRCKSHGASAAPPVRSVRRDHSSSSILRSMDSLPATLPSNMLGGRPASGSGGIAATRSLESTERKRRLSNPDPARAPRNSRAQASTHASASSSVRSSVDQPHGAPRPPSPSSAGAPPHAPATPVGPQSDAPWQPSLQPHGANAAFRGAAPRSLASAGSSGSVFDTWQQPSVAKGGSGRQRKTSSAGPGGRRGAARARDANDSSRENSDTTSISQMSLLGSSSRLEGLGGSTMFPQSTIGSAMAPSSLLMTSMDSSSGVGVPRQRNQQHRHAVGAGQNRSHSQREAAEARLHAAGRPRPRPKSHDASKASSGGIGQPQWGSRPSHERAPPPPRRRPVV